MYIYVQIKVSRSIINFKIVVMLANNLPHHLNVTCNLHLTQTPNQALHTEKNQHYNKN